MAVLVRARPSSHVANVIPYLCYDALRIVQSSDVIPAYLESWATHAGRPNMVSRDAISAADLQNYSHDVP